MSPTVPAATEDKTSVPAVDRDALSLYTTPKETFSYAEAEAGRLEDGMAALRTSLQPYSAWCRDTCGNLTPAVQRVTRVASEVCAYLRHPPEGFYPRAGIIGLAGVVGLFLGRGSRIKRVVYPAGFMAAGASLYYPKQAVAVGQWTGDRVYDWALQGYVVLDKVVRPAQTQDNTPSDTKP